MPETKTASLGGLAVQLSDGRDIGEPARKSYPPILLHSRLFNKTPQLPFRATKGHGDGSCVSKQPATKGSQDSTGLFPPRPDPSCRILTWPAFLLCFFRGDQGKKSGSGSENLNGCSNARV